MAEKMLPIMTRNNPEVMAGILRRVPHALTEEAPRDLNESDGESLDRQRKVAATGKLIADLLKSLDVEPESRSMPTGDASTRSADIEGWTVLDPEDIAVANGVFLATNGAIKRLWHTRYGSMSSTFMHECWEGSSEAMWVLESQQFQHGIAKLIAHAQQGTEVAAITDAESLS
ncbi:MAG: hypothetical protein WD467_00245 [Candidatus Saccharimonadales bacterium]